VGLTTSPPGLLAETGRVTADGFTGDENPGLEFEMWEWEETEMSRHGDPRDLDTWNDRFAEEPDQMPDLTATFLTACEGTDPDVTPLEWLSALLHEAIARGLPQTCQDEEAVWTAIQVSQKLLADLRAAVAQAKGEEETR